MRVLLVGAAADRARLRSDLAGIDQIAPDALEIAGEFPTLAAARRSSISADAVLLAPGIDGSGGDAVEPHAESEGGLAAEPLTPRERQVLDRLAEGQSNKAIA